MTKFAEEELIVRERDARTAGREGEKETEEHSQERKCRASSKNWIGGADSCGESSPPFVCELLRLRVPRTPKAAGCYFLAGGVEGCSLVGGTMPLIRI